MGTKTPLMAKVHNDYICPPRRTLRAITLQKLLGKFLENIIKKLEYQTDLKTRQIQIGLRTHWVHLTTYDPLGLYCASELALTGQDETHDT